MITLEANYSKKIGLPGYSSHQFSITLKSELADISQAEQESARLYDVLQNSVDSNIQQVGLAKPPVPPRVGRCSWEQCLSPPGAARRRLLAALRMRHDQPNRRCQRTHSQRGPDTTSS